MIFQILNKYSIFPIFILIATLIWTFTSCAVAQESPIQSIEVAESEDGTQYRFISDNLFIFMRAGPSNDYRLVGSVEAGARVELINIDREAGYAQIVDDRDRTGWVEVKFVSRTPSIREEIIRLNQQLNNKQSEIDAKQQEIDAIMQNLKKSDTQKTKLNRKITQQLEEIAKLTESIERREKASNMQWFTRGAMLGVVALLIGYALGIFGRRKANANRLM